MKRKIVAAVLAASAVLGLAACSSDADRASKNLSTAAEQFEVLRRVVFINGITDKYLLEIQGYCSVETSESGLSGSLEVTCKVGPEQYKKHFLGLSDNVSYMVEQLEPVNADPYRYRVIFKPEALIPDIDLVTSGG